MPSVKLESITPEDVAWLRDQKLNWLVCPHVVLVEAIYRNGAWQCRVVLAAARSRKRFTGKATALNRIGGLGLAYASASRHLDEYLSKLVANQRERG